MPREKSDSDQYRCDRCGCRNGISNWTITLVHVIALLLPLLSWSAPPTVEVKALLNDALRLVYAGKAQAAYDLLAPDEDRYAGNRDYDYLLGVAALDSGNPEIAVFALQRALAVDPMFSGARMDLARAYVLLEQYRHAQEEFDILLQQNPPAKTVASIRRYQQDIDRLQAQAKTRLGAYLDSSVGYDSNANSATDEDTFLGFRLLDTSKRTASSYTALQGGGSLFAPLGATTQLFTAINIKRRVNGQAAFVNSTVYDGNLALRQRVGIHALQWGLSGNAVQVNGEPNSRSAGSVLEWTHQLTPSYQLGVSGRYAQLRYPKELRIKDVDQALWSMKLSRAVARPLYSEVGLLLSTGRDFRTDLVSRYEKTFSGIRLFSQLPLTSTLMLGTALGYADSDYQGLFFGLPRADRQQDAVLELRWLVARGWSVKLLVLYTKNNSDINIYEYDKTDVGLGLRWNFLN